MTTLDPTAALVVVDLQPLTLGNARVHTAEDVLARTARLAGAFRRRASPVVFATSLGTPAGRTSYGEGGRVWPDDVTGVAPGLEVGGDDLVVARAGLSAFAGTELDALLRKAGVSQVVLVGLATTFGIEGTARAAYDLGYNVIVASDAVSDPREDAHAHALANIFPVIGEVASTAEILELLNA